MNEEYYVNAFNYCLSNRGGHLLQHSTLKMSDHKHFPENSTGYCSRCMCINSQKMEDGIHISVWLHPVTYEILDFTHTDFLDETDSVTIRLSPSI